MRARNIGDFPGGRCCGIGRRRRRCAAADRGGHGRPAARGASAEADRPRQRGSYRAEYHFTVPDQWKNDPQRPVWIDGEYHYYYLYNPDYSTGGTTAGTAWRLATTTDLVSFTDRGVAVPKDTTAQRRSSGPARRWSTRTTRRASARARSSSSSPWRPTTDTQAQYLYYSTDGGRTFTQLRDRPVLAQPRRTPTSATPR